MSARAGAESAHHARLSSQEKSGLNWIRYDAWALPKPVSVEYDDGSGAATSLAQEPRRRIEEQREAGTLRGVRGGRAAPAKPGEWIVLETVVGGEDSYEAVIDAARLAKEGAGPDVCVRVRDTVGYTSPEGCPERLGANSMLRLTTLTSSGDPLVVQHLFGALAKPAPASDFNVPCDSNSMLLRGAAVRGFWGSPPRWGTARFARRKDATQPG